MIPLRVESRPIREDGRHDALGDDRGRTPLFVAAVEGREAAVEAPMDAGAQWNNPVGIVNAGGSLPSYVAAKFVREGVVRILNRWRGT